MHRQYYDTLGVPTDADDKTIKKAYRALAQQYHPDRNAGDAAAEAKFKAVNNAYEVLSDKDKRKLYDEFGEDAEKLGFDQERARGYRDWRAKGGVGFDGGVDMDDLLSQMFGGGLGGRGGGFRGAPRGPSKGRDISAEMTLDFRTAVRGGERTIGIDGKQVTVRIPPGVRDGGNLRLRGQGLAGARGGPSGDLLLTLSVADDPVFERDGDNLVLEVPITLGEALRGGTIEVPTLEGAVNLKVPAGAQSGQSLRLRGKGVAPKGKPAGDLLVKLKVRLPDARGHDELQDAIAALEALYTEDVRADLRGRVGAA
jgi:DnaJ-class molecular chaperone